MSRTVEIFRLPALFGATPSRSCPESLFVLRFYSLLPFPAGFLSKTTYGND